MPAHECIVLPPMLSPAIPVEAVMATSSRSTDSGPLSKRMISRNNTDFPVPVNSVSRRARASLVSDLTSRSGEEDAVLIGCVN